MKLLLLGGSFNPVHIGHLVMAEEAMHQFGYDLVALVPSLKPPHKPLADDPGAEHRLAMLCIAVRGQPRFTVDDCEIGRGGTSYTIDTVRDIAHRYSIDGRIGLLLGDDLIPGFLHWREPGSLACETDIICAHRARFERLDFPFPHRYADNPIIALSSSLIRARIADGGPVRSFLPPGVFDYISEKGLYGFH